MAESYENIRNALEAIQASARGHRHKRDLAHLDFREACDPSTIRALLAEMDALLEACRLAARYLNPDQFPDAVKKIDAAIAAANGGGNG